MTAPTPFLGFPLLAAFLVLLPVSTVWMQRAFSGGWARAAAAGFLATTAGFLAVLTAYTAVLRGAAPAPLLAPAHGEWAVTRADPPFALAAFVLFAVAAWMSAVAVYPASARPAARSRAAALAGVDVLVIVLLFALSAL